METGDADVDRLESAGFEFSRTMARPSFRERIPIAVDGIYKASVDPGRDSDVDLLFFATDAASEEAFLLRNDGGRVQGALLKLPGMPEVAADLDGEGARLPLRRQRLRRRWPGGLHEPGRIDLAPWTAWRAGTPAISTATGALDLALWGGSAMTATTTAAFRVLTNLGGLGIRARDVVRREPFKRNCPRLTRRGRRHGPFLLMTKFKCHESDQFGYFEIAGMQGTQDDGGHGSLRSGSTAGPLCRGLERRRPPGPCRPQLHFPERHAAPSCARCGEDGLPTRALRADSAGDGNQAAPWTISDAAAILAHLFLGSEAFAARRRQTWTETAT